MVAWYELHRDKKKKKKKNNSEPPNPAIGSGPLDGDVELRVIQVYGSEPVALVNTFHHLSYGLHVKLSLLSICCTETDRGWVSSRPSFSVPGNNGSKNPDFPLPEKPWKLQGGEANCSV